MTLQPLRILLISLLFLLGLGLHAQSGPVPTGSGKALYVAPTGGNDAYTRDQNDLTHPWATVQRAWYQARPGDVVYFRAGTYVLTERVVTKNNGTNGTAENPIVFTNYPNEIATIDAQNIPSPYSIAFNLMKNYNYVVGTPVNGAYGFRFINYETCFFLAEDLPADHFEVSGVEAIANRAGDNSAFVKVGDYTVVRNNKISGINPGGVYGCATMAFGHRFYKVLNNYFDNLSTSSFQKHPNLLNAPSDIEYAYNYITNCGIGLKWNGNHSSIHDNIFVNCLSHGLETGDDGGGSSTVNSLADYNTIKNNTFVNCAMTFEVQGAPPGAILRGSNYNTIENNVFMGRNNWHMYDLPSPNYDFANQTDHNLYPNTANAIVQNRIDYSLQGWRDYQLQTHSRLVDAHSITGSPVFVGGAAPTTIAGYALALGSPGKNAGSDGKDMGADVSRVGIQPLSSLTVTSPNGGEAWRRGETRAITWTASGVMENLTIELMQGPTLLGVIATGLAPASGSFTWTVGRLDDGTFRTGTNLKIRIRTASGRVLALAGVGASPTSGSKRAS